MKNQMFAFPCTWYLFMKYHIRAITTGVSQYNPLPENRKVMATDIPVGSLGLDLLACRGDCRGVFDRACREDKQGGGQEKDNEREGK